MDTSHLQHAVVIGAVLLALRGLAKGRLKPTSQPGALAYPLSMLVAGIATTLLFYGMLIASTTFAANETTTWWTSLIFLGFGTTGAALIVEYFRSRHQLTADGLSYGRLLGARRSLVWRDVTKVKFSHMNKWFVLSTADGRKVRISCMLQGLPAFATAVLAHAGHVPMHPQTRALLERTSRGDLPRLY